MFAAISDDDAAQVPANLAWTFAQTGRRVLLVDLDLRAAAIAEAFSIEEEVGLADLLTGRADLDDVVRSTASPQLDVLISGTGHAGARPICSVATSCAGLLRRLERDYEIVVLHAPAVLSFADAAMVAGARRGDISCRSGRDALEARTSLLPSRPWPMCVSVRSGWY